MRNRSEVKRPSAATALAALALVVAVGGNTDAFSSSKVIVRKGDIAKGAVTANALAKGAVHAKALASGAVGVKAIKAGSVTSAALGADSVTASAITPGSVYGGALGAVSLHTAAIADPDKVPSNPEWTPSTTVEALCGAGERLVTGGVVLTDPGNNEVGVLTSVPTSQPGANGFVGQITSNSGGTAKAEVQALCLK
jgi:zona occludens toxin (predicted ATPase)